MKLGGTKIIAALCLCIVAQLATAQPAPPPRDPTPDEIAAIIEAERLAQEGKLRTDPLVGIAVQMAKDLAPKLLPGVWRMLSGAANVLTFITGLLVIMLYAIFLLIDYDNIAKRWREYLPPDMRDDVSGFVGEFIQATNRYFRSQALVACCVAVLFVTGFSIISLPLAILMGIFIGLLNMVPYLQILGIIPCLFLAGLKTLEQGDSFLGGLGIVILVFGVVQVIQETLLVPRIQGKAMGLSPAIILLSISVWGKLLGFLGLILALPLTCLGLTYYRRHLWKYDHPSYSPEFKE